VSVESQIKPVAEAPSLDQLFEASEKAWAVMMTIGTQATEAYLAAPVAERIGAPETDPAFLAAETAYAQARASLNGATSNNTI